jgi:hypothetical protein
MTHPIKPHPTLLQHWIDTIAYPHNDGVGPSFHDTALATLAAQWGADQELDACYEWLEQQRLRSVPTPDLPVTLRAIRRPKPPSLKKQALAELENMVNAAKEFGFGGTNPIAIRRALEQLDD